ncbi:hypothetical protein Tco_0199852 [Tanacetum coccineum]
MFPCPLILLQNLYNHPIHLLNSGWHKAHGRAISSLLCNFVVEISGGLFVLDIMISLLQFLVLGSDSEIFRETFTKMGSRWNLDLLHYISSRKTTSSNSNLFHGKASPTQAMGLWHRRLFSLLTIDFHTLTAQERCCEALHLTFLDVIIAGCIVTRENTSGEFSSWLNKARRWYVKEKQNCTAMSSAENESTWRYLQVCAHKNVDEDTA